jgi:hypothetical protein
LQARAREMMKKTKERWVTEEKIYYIREFPEKGPWFENIHTRFKTFKTLDLLTKFQRFSSRMNYDEEMYKKALERGTKIRIIIDKPSQNVAPILASINSLRKSPNFEIRYSRTLIQVVVIIVNQKEAALALSSLNRAGPPYLCSDHPSFVHMAQQYFETMWNEATEETFTQIEPSKKKNII